MLNFLFDHPITIFAILFIVYYGLSACIMMIETVQWTIRSTNYSKHSKTDTVRSVYGLYWIVPCLAIWMTFDVNLHVHLQITVTFVAVAALIAKFFHTLYFFPPLKGVSNGNDAGHCPHQLFPC